MNKQQIIFIVGPDRCGKSHIAQALSERLQVPYFKPTEERLNFVGNQSKFIYDLRFADPRMVDFLKQTQHSVVFDRGYPCEFVYSNFYKRETDMGVLHHIDQSYAELGAVIIVTYRSNYDHVVDDLDTSLTGNKLFQLEELYRTFAKWSDCRTFFLNVDSENIEHQLTQVDDFLNS